MPSFPKFFGVVFLVGSLAVVAKMVYDASALQFWTTPWYLGILAILALTGIGFHLLFTDDTDFARSLLCSFGYFYTIAGGIVYALWGLRHLLQTLEPGDFFGFFFLFATVGGIAAIGLLVTAKERKQKRIFLFPAWIMAIGNVAVTFTAVAKYVFLHKPWFFWPSVGELLTIVIGAILFLTSYLVSQSEYSA